MTAVTLNYVVQFPYPGVEVVNVTAAATGATYKSKFANIDGVLGSIQSTTGTAADLKYNFTTTPGTVAITTAGTATVLTLMIFGH